MFKWFKKSPPLPENVKPASSAAAAGNESRMRAGDKHEYTSLRKLGNEFLAHGKLEEAATCYRQAIAANPGHAEGFLNLGFVSKELKRYEDAEHALLHALQIDPTLADAHFLLGGIAQELDNPAKSIEHFQKALEIRPDFEIVYSDLYLILLQCGQIENARKVVEQGLSIFPQSVQFHSYLGNLYVAERNPEMAIHCYQQALLIQPDSADLHNNLGTIFHEQGDLGNAENCYRKALALNPDNAGLHSNLGAIFLDRADLDNAQACFHKALALNPDSTDTLNNLGLILRTQGNLHEAAACYRKALTLRQDSSEIYNNLGSVLRDLDNFQEASDCYKKALKLKPEDAVVLNNLGVLSHEHHHMDEARDYLSRALVIKPDFPLAQNNLGLVFQDQWKLDKALLCFRQAVTLMPDFHAARANLLHVMQQLCEWSELEPLSQKVRQGINPAASPTIENQIAPFSFLAVPGSTPLEQKICATNWARSKFHALTTLRKEMKFEFEQGNKHKLHIGYLSADFRDHPVAHLMAQIFELHDRERFYVTAYSFGPDEAGPMRSRLEKAFDHFVDIRDLTHENAARKIFEDRVDILVDLTGYTKYTRSEILALRPAPLQVSYLGYLGTSGADFMDYIIADEFLIPAEHKINYTEKVAYLPSYQANDRQCAVAETPTRKSCGLPEDGVVFCCFNQTYKVLPDVFDVWMRLLKAVPGSVFWVYVSNTYAAANLQHEAQTRGVAPERLIFAETLPLDKHLARLKCADLFLDTLPYNAGTTASNALWAGLPVITCAGETFSSRMAGSLLIAMGIPELITHNLEDYFALALDLATDRTKYENIRNKIIANRDTTPLFDSTKFTHNLEALYLQMWHDYVSSPHHDMGS